MSVSGRAHPGQSAGQFLHGAPVARDPQVGRGLLQVVASVFFVASMMLSGLLALAVASLAVHAVGSGAASELPTLGFMTLGNAERIALGAVLSWIPTIGLLTALSRARAPRS